MNILLFPNIIFQINEHLEELWLRDNDTIKDSPNDDALTIIVAIISIYIDI